MLRRGLLIDETIWVLATATRGGGVIVNGCVGDTLIDTTARLASFFRLQGAMWANGDKVGVGLHEQWHTELGDACFGLNIAIISDNHSHRPIVFFISGSGGSSHRSTTLVDNGQLLQFLLSRTFTLRTARPCIPGIERSIQVPSTPRSVRTDGSKQLQVPQKQLKPKDEPNPRGKVRSTTGRRWPPSRWTGEQPSVDTLHNQRDDS
mmetsp:Transcript_12802/g.28093  ORF Transcript_12802/g.28093 Transcript_12802/m.28093 type:complete len:206 (+) Transcript_12802:325-942(+)